MILRGAILLIAAATLMALGAAADAPKANKLPDKAKAILDKANQFDLLSLDPDPDRAQVKDGFHGWKVLGKTVVKDPQVRKQVLESLYEGISKSDGVGAKCFEPRHGIRASVEGKTVDLVICFECSWVYVFFDKEEKRQGVAVTTDKPQPTWDKVLKDAGVALPKPEKK
jgi:hypothetical protein